MEEQKKVELAPEVIDSLKEILGRLNELLDDLPPQAKAAAGILAAILGYPKVKESLSEEDARDLHDVLFDLEAEVKRRTYRVNIVPILQRAIAAIRSLLERLGVYPYRKPYYGYRYYGYRYYYPAVYRYPAYKYPYYRYPYYKYPAPTPYKAPRIRAAASLVEAVEGSEGREWEARLIKIGLSENRMFYPADVLKEAQSKFEGVKVFIDHPTREERKSLPEGSIRDIAGWIEDVRMGDDGLYGRLMISEGQPWLMDMLKDAYDRGKTDLVGLSILGDGKLRWEQKDGQGYWLVESINHIQRVDLVTAPAAGGSIIELIESQQKTEVEKEMSEQEVMEQLPLLEPEPTIAEAKSELNEMEKRFEELESKVRIHECRALLAESLSECNLPRRARERIRARFDNRIFEMQELEEAIEDERKYLAELASEVGPGFGSIRVGETDTEKKIKALEGMLVGEPIDQVTPFRSLREAYSVITGTPILDVRAEQLLAEARGFDSGLLRETVTTATWSNILGIAMTRAMLKFYRQPELDEWRLIASAIVPLRDFRTQERVRMPAVEGLPEVAEGGPYQELAPVSDEKVTYAAKTYGFLYPLTRRVIINDDLGALREIPRILGRSAKVGLYRHIFLDLIEANPTVYDGKALFHADHKNDLGAGKALNDATLSEAKAKMRAQVAFGTTADYLALKPAFLLVDPSIEAVARKLEQGEYAYRVAVDTVGVATHEPNIHRGTFRTIVVDHFDTAKAGVWYLVADPAAINTIEVGFLEGRQEPELFVQEAPEIGSVFTADKITYKLRFEFQGVILDWRAFLRANI